MRRTASSTTPRPCGRRRTSGGWVVACSLARRAAVVSAVVQAAADVVVAAHAHDHGSSRSSVGGGDSAQLPSFLFILGDDIGWADMGYSGGTARTPHIDEWAESEGSIKMMDFHSGGTVCSPTRASLLTGRTPYRDCVFGVYPCSDMTECLLRPIDWLSVFLSLFLSLPPSPAPPFPLSLSLALWFLCLKRYNCLSRAVHQIHARLCVCPAANFYNRRRGSAGITRLPISTLRQGAGSGTETVHLSMRVQNRLLSSAVQPDRSLSAWHCSGIWVVSSTTRRKLGASSARLSSTDLTISTALLV